MQTILARHSRLIQAVLLSVLYIVSLHPISGFIGGIVFFFTGWAIPTIVVFLIALWIASFFKEGNAQIIAFTIAFIAIGLNSKIIDVIDLLTFDPDTNWHVERPIDPGREESYHIQTEKNIRGEIIARPTLPFVEVGGDEGCGCMYFKKNRDANYYSRISWAIHKPSIFYSSMPVEKSTEWETAFSYAEEMEEGNKTAKIVFKIHDSDGVAAYFIQKGLPVFDIKSRGTILGSKFCTNTMDVLLHGNIVTTLFSKLLPSRFDSNEFIKFNKEAYSRFFTQDSNSKTDTSTPAVNQ